MYNIDINSGASPDWAYGQLGIIYAYVLELRPGPGTDDYVYGFTLPEDRMPLVAPEVKKESFLLASKYKTSIPYFPQMPKIYMKS